MGHRLHKGWDIRGPVAVVQMFVSSSIRSVSRCLDEVRASGFNEFALVFGRLISVTMYHFGPSMSLFKHTFRPMKCKQSANQIYACRIAVA